MNNRKLLCLIKQNLSDDLRKSKYRGHPNRMKGHCYVASETFYHLCLNPKHWIPGTLKHEDDVHWVLKNKKPKKYSTLLLINLKKCQIIPNLEVGVFLRKPPVKEPNN